MRDVWIYAPSRDATETVGHALAELGFAPHYVGSGEITGQSAAETFPSRPSLAVVVAGPDEAVPSDLLDHLWDNESLDDLLPVLVVVEAQHLGAYASLAASFELLVSPFSIQELELRIARATRDFAVSETSPVIRVASLELNLDTYQVSVDGAPIAFAYMEYELLRFLVTHPNRVFSREALLKRVWGYDYFGGARTVDVHIRRVRAKLGQEHAGRIRTVRSVGYLFEHRQSATAAA